ncbi:MAG: hotdog fold domain-containing protein [Clostridiales bacterium]|nr:hotdog fold domain-containing protein [Clostridiales bacterium]
MIGTKVIHKKMMTVENDGHYLGNLINGSRMLDYFGDVGTELMVRATGDGSLFRAYKEVEFLAPVHVTDIMEYHGWIEKRGKTSFEVHFECYKIFTMTDQFKVKHGFLDAFPKGEPDLSKHYASEAAMVKCDPPLLCGRAIGIMVVPVEYQGEPLDPAFKEEH